MQIENAQDTSTQTFSHFGMFAFKDAYWELDTGRRTRFHQEWLRALRAAAPKVEIFQATESDIDLIVWSALTVNDQDDPAAFFRQFAKALAPHHHLIEPRESLWGLTRPSQYSKARSRQEIDPFADERRRYLVIYPFSKTTEWYLMSRDSRQGMMNEHIRIGKQYEQISQLLLYSFGLQNQEFVVVYEMDDLTRFSELVNELRDTEARRYTLRDTPLHTAVHYPAEETLALWK